MYFQNWPSWCLICALTTIANAEDDAYNNLNRDGSFQFGYNNPDSYHHAAGNRNNEVRGEFGGRNPGTGRIDSTQYTAGPRGYRPRGKNVHRKFDLNQNGPRPIGTRDDPYADPYEDPSYNFAFKTRTYNREETANRIGDVAGRYNYVDDVGEVHNVEFIAGKNTGFHVKTPYPDSNPRAYFGRLYYRGRGKPIPRGRTSIQRGLDGSYRFVSAGPDQRRTETSDATGHVRGSYTYLDDKGVQHSVHYIAGPETGYKVLKNVKGPHLPTLYPFGTSDIIPSDFYDYKEDVFDTAASGHVKPINNGNKKPNKDSDFEGNLPTPGLGDSNRPFGSGNKRPFSGNRPDDDSFGDFGGDDFDGELFGPSGSKPRPSKPSSGQKPGGDRDDGSYKPHLGSHGGGAYIPPGDQNQDDGSYKPGPDEAGLGTGLPRPGGFDSKPSRPSGGSKPPFTDDYDDSNGLFGSESNGRPPLRPPPVIQIQGSEKPGCERCAGTIVTNIGDKPLSVPPGVSVRAHVQSIDLLPLVSKVPSPSEQYNEEMGIKTEQLSSAASNLISNSTVTESNKETTVSTTTVATTTTSVTEITTLDDVGDVF